jgi:hypothetical protein
VRINPVDGPGHNNTATVEADGRWKWSVDLKPGTYALRVVQKHVAILGGGESEPLATAEVALDAGETEIVDFVIDI